MTKTEKVVGGALLVVGSIALYTTLFPPGPKKFKRHGWTVTKDCTRFHQNNFGQWSIFMENHLAETGLVPGPDTAEQILASAFGTAFPECTKSLKADTKFTFAAAPGISATWEELIEQVKQAWGGLEAGSQLGIMFGGIQ